MTQDPPRPAREPTELPKAAASRVRSALHRTLILDYDGTLVPFAATPDLAVPDADLLALLAALGARAGVHLVSGRPRADLERWFGALPIGLHAEHGFWSRGLEGAPWIALGPVATAWKDAARALLHGLAERTRGAFVEEKTATLGWHYRAADPEVAAERLAELRESLAPLLADHDLELLEGAKVLEIRPRGVHKGRAVTRILAAGPEGAAVVAVGDDRTDEDVFAALPEGAVSIHVGPGPSRAAYRLPDSGAVRAFLRAIVEP